MHAKVVTTTTLKRSIQGVKRSLDVALAEIEELKQRNAYLEDLCIDFIPKYIKVYHKNIILYHSGAENETMQTASQFD